ncbi:anhydrase, family 3 protein [Luminiphilus syltensis NOR5-1B]|uniref:Anhydrase, family 3 protein n=1 Tax=Luminiphilus syltensis NOR5-1B TaxID=565045 RepID=B8KUG7_9GAMM|nr:gamma carbonic anhydrase family protein [Luminiphilus syltensis]EED34439.1 anhydrase, family 3 protein [Luminiphilus syltensis NOR5-1B]
MNDANYTPSDNIRRFGDWVPTIGSGVMIDPSAVVLGDITLGDDVSIWPHCSVRADMHRITIGNRTNIQDNSVLHITHAGNFNPDGFPLTIGSEVTVGHRALLHGCTIGNRVLIGMGAIVMDGAVVEDEVMIAAGALVTPGKHLPSGYVYGGSPARQMREMTDKEREFLSYSAGNYVNLKNTYLNRDQS